jgi:diacylglycerol O-acyltransferase-1
MIRYFLEDYKDYGFIMKIPLNELTISDTCAFLGIFCFLSLACLICFFIEKWRIRRLELLDGSKKGIISKKGSIKKSKRISKFILVPFSTSPSSLSYLFLFCLFASFSTAVWLTSSFIKHVYVSGWSHVAIWVFTFKLISFYLVSHELNPPVSLSHFLYFIVAPTFCYQLSYPMSSTRRFSFILRRVVQLVLGVFLFVFVMDQYSIPSIYRAIENPSWLIKCENVINVAISSAFLFLIFFHMVFVCALDILAEITLFGDRNFYQAWWNSETVGEFWTLWNIPVHNWFKRHLYIPLVKRGTHKQLARAYCFFVSAIIHEFVFSLATRRFSGLIFIAMIFQIPNIYVSERVKNSLPFLANTFFWCSFCVIGQPAIVLLYYRSKWLKEMGLA